MRITFLFKPTVREIPGFRDHSGHYATLGSLQLQLHEGEVSRYGPCSLIEAREYALPEVLRAHLARAKIEDEFVCVESLPQGLYEVTVEGVAAKAELNRRYVRDSVALDTDTQVAAPWQQLEYRLLVLSPSFEVARGLYAQIREGKITPTKNWDGLP